MKMDKFEVLGIIEFIQAVEALKNTLRSAKTSTGRQESSAEHSWRLGLLCMVCAHNLPDISLEKMLKLAMLHDLGEAVCGDVPAILQSATDNRSAQERLAVQKLIQPLGPVVQAEFLALWDEYALGNTPEACAVKALDKLETLMQHNQGKNPPDFDYAFNLHYARQYTDALPLAKILREQVDKDTRQKLPNNG